MLVKFFIAKYYLNFKSKNRKLKIKIISHGV